MMKTAHWIVLGALILQAGLSGCSKKQDQPQTDRPPVADTAEAKTEATRFAEAASEAVRQSRQRRATAIRGVVQTGLETYHAQKDQWPGTVDSLESGIVPDELAQTMIRTISSVEVGIRPRQGFDPRALRPSLARVLSRTPEGARVHSYCA